MVFDLPFYHQNAHVNITFLVVDDDPISLSMIHNMLITQTYKDKSYKEIKVLTAKDSSEALSTLRGQCKNIDVVIIDYHIPGLNGVQLKKRIDEEFGNLPVIVISADHSKQIEQTVLASGANIFYRKPLSPDDLKTMWKYARLSHRMSDPGNINANGLNEKSMRNSTKALDGKSSRKVTKIKKPKLKWTSPLRNKFLQSINHIGFSKAKPLMILEFMKMEGLTREHIASYLQKYRNNLKSVNERGCELQKAAKLKNSSFQPPNYLNSQDSYNNVNRMLCNNTGFNSQLGFGLGQSSLMMNNNDSIPNMNQLPIYDSSHTGSNFLPMGGRLGFSNGTLPMEGRFGVSSGMLPTEGRLGVSSGLLPTEGRLKVSSGMLPREGRVGVSSGMLPMEGRLGVSSGMFPTEGRLGVSSGFLPTESRLRVSSGMLPKEGRLGVSSGLLPTEGRLKVSSGMLPREGIVGVSSGMLPTEGRLGVSSGMLPTKGKLGVSSGLLPTEGRLEVSSGMLPTEGRFGVSSGLLPTESRLNVSSGILPREGRAGVSNAILPMEGRLGVSSGMLPMEGRLGVSSDMLPIEGRLGFSSEMLPLNEERRSTFGTSQAPQGPRFGQYGTTDDVLGMKSNLSTGYMTNNYTRIRLNGNGDLLAPGGRGVNVNGNGSLGGNLDAMNWTYNNNNMISNNHGSSNPMFSSAFPSFLNNEYHQPQNNLAAQMDGVVPVLENPNIYNGPHHGINEIFHGTVDSQYDQNLQRQGNNVTGENLELPNYDVLDKNAILDPYPFEDITDLDFDDDVTHLDDNFIEELLNANNIAANSEMYVPAGDMNNIDQEQEDAEIEGLLSTFGPDWEARGAL